MNAQEVKAIRTKLGITETEFAKRIGVSLVTVSRWENGHKKPTALAVNRIREIEQQSRK